MTFPPPTHRQARLIWLALSGLAIAVLVGLAAGLVWGLGRIVDILSPVLWPLAIGGVVAYLLDPVVDFLEQRLVPRPRAILFVFGIGLLLVATFVSIVVPQLVSETRQLAARVPAYTDRLQQRLERWANHPPAIIQKLLTKETANTAGAGSLEPTNSPTELAATNAPGPAILNTNAPVAVGGALDRRSLETATGWVAKV